MQVKVEGREPALLMVAQLVDGGVRAVARGEHNGTGDVRSSELRLPSITVVRKLTGRSAAAGGLLEVKVLIVARRPR